MSSNEVFAFAQNMTDAVMCLRDGGHHLQSVMLTYVAIEQMAWLSVEPLKTSGEDFKAWVDAYLLPNTQLPCTSAELWEARNGTLHMGSAESAKNRDSGEIRKILYVYGRTPGLANKSEGLVVVRTEELIVGFLNAVTWFLPALEADQAKMSTAKGKLDRMLVQRQLPSLTTSV